MKKLIVATTFATSLSVLSLIAEPSAFGAGDLTESNPYGLTKEEKLLLQTKQKLKKVTVKSNNQSNELESLRDRIDGLQSVLENLSRKSHKNQQLLRSLKKSKELRDKNSDEYEKRLSLATENNQKEIEKLKLVIVQLSKVIDDINKDYVRKDEFNKLVEDVNKFKELVAKELKKVATSKAKNPLASKSSAQIYKEAQRYFDKKLYTKSIEYYSYLIQRKYKPAKAHFMIGEMNYKRKNYSDAIAYFKKSAKLYSKASYMPKLLLHTAYSMKHTGDKKNAKAFFKAVVVKFPGSTYAKEAKKELTLMK